MSQIHSRGALLPGSRLRPRLQRALGGLSRLVVPKSLYRIDDDLQIPRRPRKGNMVVLWVLLVLVALPFVIEAFSLWAAQWYKVMDQRLVVHTPLLDSCVGGFTGCWDELASWASCQVAEANWSPASVLPVVAGLLVIAARMLKK
jgi:hypothetical protein